MPEILSLDRYQEMWIRWWTSLQPSWRCAGDIRKCSWPLPREPPSVHGPLWDKLLAGGKDGLFIVVMSLSWWVIKHGRDSGKDSQLEEALVDVSWVLANMVSVLSSPALEDMPTASPSSHSNRSAVKVGPPKKRLRTD